MSDALGRNHGSGIMPKGSTSFFMGRVKNIVLGPYLDNTKTPNPDYNSAADVGKIIFELPYGDITSTKYNKENRPAYPMFGFLRQYPLIGEIVFIVAGPSDKLNDHKDHQKLFYLPAYALWNSVNHNVFPNMQEFNQFQQQIAMKPGYTGYSSRSGNPPEFPKGSTFTESSDIRTLTPFEGDAVIEGRFGQSIRFGSTVSKFKGYNSWSDVGTNGSPITIIRNGQGKVTSPKDPFASTVEDINTDGASIYMTSDQRIVIDDLSNFPMNSYGKSIVSTAVSNVVSVFEKPTSNDYSAASDQDEKTFS